jgi:GTP1/Obg family GTP-binding protein
MANVIYIQYVKLVPMLQIAPRLVMNRLRRQPRRQTGRQLKQLQSRIMDLVRVICLVIQAHLEEVVSKCRQLKHLQSQIMDLARVLRLVIQAHLEEALQESLFALQINVQKSSQYAFSLILSAVHIIRSLLPLL